LRRFKAIKRFFFEKRTKKLLSAGARTIAGAGAKLRLPARSNVFQFDRDPKIAARSFTAG
jgi:hypothetical protein